MRWWRDGLGRLGVRTGPGRDAVAAALLVVLLTGGRLVVALLVAARQPNPDPVTGGAVAGGLLITVLDGLTIALRRRVPRTALLAAAAVVAGSVPLVPVFAEPGLGLVVCAYTVASLLPWRRSGPVLAVAAAGHAVAGITLVDLYSLPTYWGVPGTDRSAVVLASLASTGLPALAGSWARARRAALDALRRERDERARTAVREERGRIARELHDVAAHDLSAIVVQAGAADRLLEADPEAARETLRAIRGQGRDTLGRLRGLVGVLRAEDAEGRSPAPSLLRLDDLVAGLRATGTAVEVLTAGTSRPLPPEVDSAAYRVVQEALVNARQHAPGAGVAVAVDWTGDGVGVTVRNGPGGPDPGPGSGHGLLGMRERVQRAGGTLRVGSGPTGGWTVSAHFPVPRAPDR